MGEDGDPLLVLELLLVVLGKGFALVVFFVASGVAVGFVAALALVVEVEAGVVVLEGVVGVVEGAVPLGGFAGDPLFGVVEGPDARFGFVAAAQLVAEGADVVEGGGLVAEEEFVDAVAVFEVVEDAFFGEQPMDEGEDGFFVLDAVGAGDEGFLELEFVEGDVVFFEEFADDVFDGEVLEDAAVAGEVEGVEVGDDGGGEVPPTRAHGPGFEFMDDAVYVPHRFVFIPDGDEGFGVEQRVEGDRALFEFAPAEVGVVEVELGDERFGEGFSEF